MRMAHVVYLALAGFLGGAFGSMVGLGGGIFIVPALVLFLDVPVHSAVSASLLGVVATSTTGSITYLRQGLTNLRLTVTIETALSAGALTGGIVGVMLDKEALSAIFGGLMVIVAVYMVWRRKAAPAPLAEGAELGRFGACYVDPGLHRKVTYSVRRLSLGLFAGLAAGNVSGLLGVGGGWLTVPTLRLGMGVPMRAAVATSSLMLGVTACAGALVYLVEGLVDPATAVPVVLGVAAGAVLGSRLAARVKSSVLVVVLAVVLLALAVEMILASVGISLR